MSHLACGFYSDLRIPSFEKLLNCFLMFQVSKTSYSLQESTRNSYYSAHYVDADISNECAYNCCAYVLYILYTHVDLFLIGLL